MSVIFRHKQLIILKLEFYKKRAMKVSKLSKWPLTLIFTIHHNIKTNWHVLPMITASIVLARLMEFVLGILQLKVVCTLIGKSLVWMLTGLTYIKIAQMWINFVKVTLALILLVLLMLLQDPHTILKWQPINQMEAATFQRTISAIGHSQLIPHKHIQWA